MWYSKFQIREVLKMELKDVPGIGDKSVEKLNAKGITTIDELLSTKPAELAQIIGVNLLKAKQILNNASQWLSTQ
jgi:predicted flap endonuclease-1-like 5' DNA nuclease